MLLPALNSAREKARRISCASNQKQLGLAFQLYVNYPDDVILPLFTNNSSAGGLSGLTVGGVMTDMKMFICPSTTTPVGTYASGGTVEAANLDYHYISGLNAARVTSDSAILFDSAQGSGAGTTTTDNHDKFGNMLFGDGHVGSNVGTAKGNWLALNKTGWDSVGFGIPDTSATSSGAAAAKAGNAANTAVN